MGISSHVFFCIFIYFFNLCNKLCIILLLMIDFLVAFNIFIVLCHINYEILTVNVTFVSSVLPDSYTQASVLCFQIGFHWRNSLKILDSSSELCWDRGKAAAGGWREWAGAALQSLNAEFRNFGWPNDGGWKWALSIKSDNQTGLDL